jgi:hypothetical protein
MQGSQHRFWAMSKGGSFGSPPLPSETVPKPE